MLCIREVQRFSGVVGRMLESAYLAEGETAYVCHLRAMDRKNHDELARRASQPCPCRSCKENLQSRAEECIA